MPVAGNQDPTKAPNTGRITTYARVGSENAHTLKNQCKYLGHRAHNSRLVAVGRAKTAKYSAKYNCVYANKIAEMPKLNIEYLVAVGLYNWLHAKFPR